MNIKDIRCNQDCLEENKRLIRVFEESQQAEVDNFANCWKISYLNINSLNAHYKDMSNDNAINNSDMIGLGETWMERNTTINIENFQGHFASFGRGKGAAGFTKMALIEEPGIVASKTHSAVSFKTSKFHVIFLYLSSGYDKEAVSKLLDKWIHNDVPTTVMGDMNENILSKSKLELFMKSKGFTQLVKEPTYIQGSVIDHVYINQAMEKKNVLTKINSCYYSDHDVITLYIKK
jgi:hypothetical protein